MRAVITGGAGFIGSHLAEYLIEQGVEVVILDNFQTGSRTNLAKIAHHPNLSIYCLDISREELTSYFSHADWVFHLAGLADVALSHSNPALYFQMNVTATMKVIESAKNCNVKRLIYAASASCYGLNPPCPTDEEAPLFSSSPYALTKKMGEELVLLWHKLYQMPALSLRLFNVYGPRSFNKTVFSVFLEQKKAGKPFTVVGDGNQSRDFVFVTDVAKAFFLAARSDYSGEVFNVGSNQWVTINQLVKLLGGSATYLPARVGDPLASCADITKIGKWLSWSPEISLETGIEKMLCYAQDRH